jgi:choline dehydrogenase-like flavoprotein
MDFDAIVIGSGISGGWAAKELCERGLRTLMIERGRRVNHRSDYQDFAAPWELPHRGQVPEDEIRRDYAIQSTSSAFNSATQQWWVKDSEHPYLTPEAREFRWLRGHHLGGRSLTWARQSYRLSDIDFGANKKDGHGVDWPIRYADLSPWYDRVETFSGISGNTEGLEQLPDGRFLKPLDLNCAELDFKRRLESNRPTRRVTIGRCAHLTELTAEHIALGRGPCQMRNVCERGCGYGAYFSTLSATLPAAERTGNLTVVTDAIVEKLDYDPAKRRVSAVRVIDARTKERRSYQARVVFLCASTLPTAQILLNSRSETFPQGLANRSDQVGRNLMDHVFGIGAMGNVPGLLDRYYYGRRPTGIIIPRYANVTEDARGEYARGWSFQGRGKRTHWERAIDQPGVGAQMKAELREPGPWQMVLSGFAEMLPRSDNRVTLDERQIDASGLPLLHVDCTHGENEHRLAAQAQKDALEMLAAAGCTNVRPLQSTVLPPGSCAHEMGTARMGLDPSTSVLNRHNQVHDVPNLYITDGSCMTSSSCVGPSLTYMALSARAAHHAADLLATGEL